MVDPMLLIITIGFPLLMLAGNAFLVAHYLHPDEKQESNILKFIVVRQLALTCANSRPEPRSDAMLDCAIARYVFFRFLGLRSPNVRSCCCLLTWYVV